MGTAIGLGVVIGLVLAGFLALRRLDGRVADQAWSLLEAVPSAGTFAPGLLVGLPAPARRYLERAIRPGAVLRANARVRLEGRIRLDPRKGWAPFEAQQIVSPPTGFVWKALITPGRLRLAGADFYAVGAGGACFWLGGLFPAVRLGEPDIVRSARDRMCSEAFLCPTSLLPSACVRWEAIDDRSARLWLTVDAPVAVTFEVDDAGDLQRVTLDRWSDRSPDGAFGPVPYAVDCFEPKTFGDCTIPTRYVARWWPGDAEREFEFLEARVESAQF